MKRHEMMGMTALALCACAGLADAQGLLTSEVSYQGRLTDGGLTPTGVYDFQFRLFDAPAAGAQVGLTAFEDNVQVTGGLFTASPDFGTDAFSASKQLWVQVEVRPGASLGAFTVLSPRQRMLSAPVASSLRVPLVMNLDPGTANMFDLTRTGGGRVMQLQQIDDGAGYHALRVDSNTYAAGIGSRNAGTGPGIYTSSSSTTMPTIELDNLAATGTAGIEARISGDTSGLLVTRGLSTATKPGVHVTLGSTAASTIGGQFTMSGDAGASSAGVKGEILGTAASSGSVGVWGTNTLGYGMRATSSSNYALLAETTNGPYTIFATNSTGSFGVGGVLDGASTNSGDAGVLGWSRTSTGGGSGVWALSESTTAYALFAQRRAGTGTTPTIYAVNPSTTSNALGVHSVMTATTGGSMSTAVHGESMSTGGGGIGVWGSHAGTGYGVFGSTTGAGYAVYGSAGTGGTGVRGQAASDANGNGWAGYFAGQVYISTELGIGVVNPTNPIQHSSGARLTAGGVWTNASDKSLKENFTPVDPARVLSQVVSLPITSWNYKVESKDIKHLGPMAQDFKSAFGLGDSDRVIATVDADGVALAAIQGLNRKLEARDAEIADLKKRDAANELRIRALEDAVAKLNTGKTEVKAGVR